MKQRLRIGLERLSGSFGNGETGRGPDQRRQFGAWAMAPALAMALLVAMLAYCRGARAEYLFNEDNYRQLADADSPESIPIGTKITLQNWQQYRKFMTVQMQAAFSGQYARHIGAEPMYTMEVGPATDFPPPGDMAKNTEKYSGQARLEKLPSGGYTIKGYVAGVPFPNPQEPDRGVKMLYNAWTTYRPNILHNLNVGFLVDRYGNKTTNDVDAAFFELSHLSEPGLPIDMPYAKGRLYATRYYVTAPEQSKYTTQITEVYDDPTRLPENYVFLPSLRRSLRLSAAARCSPILGTDYIQDDNSWLPPNFDVRFLGDKKLLTWIGDPAKGFQRSTYQGVAAGEPGGTWPGWPKYGTGHWELRKYHILDLVWLPGKGSYCYSHSIFYIEAQNNIRTMGDGYDTTNKLWKAFWLFYTPLMLRGQKTMFVVSYSAPTMTDFQNTHSSIATVFDQKINDEVPGEYKDVQGMSDPGSLARIMK